MSLVARKVDWDKLNQEFEGQTAQEFLGWALKEFSSAMALASSFGAEDVVLIDILWRLDPKSGVFSLDTGRLHEVSYEVMEAMNLTEGERARFWRRQD